MDPSHSQRFQLHVLKTTIKVPAQSTDEVTAATSTATRTAGFERKPGTLARLKGQFGKLKSTMAEGRTKAKSVLATSRKSIGSLDSFVSNIRRNSVEMRPPSRSHGRSISSNDASPVKPETDGHSSVLVALISNQNSRFQQMDPSEKEAVLVAFDVCTAPSGNKSAPLEGLLLLQDCIDNLTTSSTDTPEQSSSSGNNLYGDLLQMKQECMTRIAALTAKAPDKKPGKTSNATNDSLPKPAQTTAPTTPATPAPKAKPSDIQAATSASLDDKSSALAKQPKLINSGISTGQTDREIAIQAELDALLREAEAHSAQSKTPVDKAPAPTDGKAVGGRDPQAAKPSNLDHTSSTASTGQTPINPSLAEFDELDALAMELEKSGSKHAPASAGKTIIDPSLAEFDELDALAMAVREANSKTEPDPAVQRDADIAELADLDQLMQDMTQSLQTDIDTDAGSTEANMHLSATGKSSTPPDRLE